VAEYDDIIVGGGSAGITLATRLTEDAARRVLLVEAGPDDGRITAADRLADQMQFAASLTEWGTQATFVPGNTLNYPQGRKMGGGSAVNGAFAVRGLPDDYQRWAAFGGDAWSWAEMERCLQRLESDQDFPGGEHGTDGPVPVVRWRRDELLPVQEAFLAAVTGQGIGWVDDLNAPTASGIGAIPMNRRDGVRMSTALTYLPLARGRENLTVWPSTQVARIQLERGRATGVECIRGANVEVVRGSRIVVCAGAFQSPALLMRSGIGPSTHLAALGVDCAVDLPGVGENLMDHQGTAVFLVPRGPLEPADDRVCQLGARYTSSAGDAADDMWLSMWSAWDLSDVPELREAIGAPAISAVIVGVHDPRSRGTVRLRSVDPTVAPEIDFRMLTGPTDLDRLVEGLERAIDLASSPAFADGYAGIGLLEPSAIGDREALERYITATVAGWFHASGTCRMGPDPGGGAVVDGGLRVHGVDSLHIADASVMPTVPRAPTNLSSIAIGERVAELLR
jgi:choline dehydrogenase